MNGLIPNTAAYVDAVDLTPGGIANHVDIQDDGTWKCKKTSASIKVKTVGRSMIHTTTGAGFGEVRLIDHLYCSECNGKIQIGYGEPLYVGDMIRKDSETGKALCSTESKINDDKTRSSWLQNPHLWLFAGLGIIIMLIFLK